MLFGFGILLTQSLHGLSLVPYWSAGVERIFSIAPNDLKGAYLGLFSMSFFPLAFSIGSVVWSVIYERYGGHSVSMCVCNVIDSAPCNVYLYV